MCIYSLCKLVTMTLSGNLDALEKTFNGMFQCVLVGLEIFEIHSDLKRFRAFRILNIYKLMDVDCKVDINLHGSIYIYI